MRPHKDKTTILFPKGNANEFCSRGKHPGREVRVTTLHIHHGECFYNSLLTTCFKGNKVIIEDSCGSTMTTLVIESSRIATEEAMSDKEERPTLEGGLQYSSCRVLCELPPRSYLSRMSHYHR